MDLIDESTRRDEIEAEDENNFYLDYLEEYYARKNAGESERNSYRNIRTEQDAYANSFNSYFQRQFLASKYLHRINLGSRSYKVSFLPIVPHVFTKYSDNVITTDEAIMSNHQIVYDFIKLSPKSSKVIEFKYSDLFENKNKMNNVSKDYNIKLLNKNSNTPTKFYTTSKLSGKYNFSFEFAVYKSVSLLCKQAAYYMQEYAFDKQSINFKVLTLPVKVNSRDYLLLK
jgi:hypothetical protein